MLCQYICVRVFSRKRNRNPAPPEQCDVLVTLGFAVIGYDRGFLPGDHRGAMDLIDNLGGQTMCWGKLDLANDKLGRR